jgi:hypothetical protein
MLVWREILTTEIVKASALEPSTSLLQTATLGKSTAQAEEILQQQICCNGSNDEYFGTSTSCARTS